MSIATSAFTIALEAAGGTMGDGDGGAGEIVRVELNLSLQACGLVIRVTRRNWMRRANAPCCQTTSGCSLRHRDLLHHIYLRLFTIQFNSEGLVETRP